MASAAHENGIAKKLRKKIISLVSRTGSSHVGAAFSAVDILVALYFRTMSVDPKDMGKPHDRFILSKGHGCAALYAVLAAKGFFPESMLDGFYTDGGSLPGHPVWNCAPGVEATTGSLGHGLSISVGMALANKSDRVDKRVYVLLGDGECDEGSVWEAAMSAGQFKLDNLVAIIDYNHLQAFGRVEEVMDLEPLARKWESFGWSVKEADGHDIDQLAERFAQVPFEKGKPSLVIAHTVKGKGVSFMENQLAWHYKSPNTQEAENAVRELDDQ